MIEEDDCEVISAQWVMDGSVNLMEAAMKLRDFANFLEAKHKDGFELLEEIDDDQGFVYHPLYPERKIYGYEK